MEEDEFRLLLRENITDERELKRLLDENRAENAQELERLMLQINRRYKDIILTFPSEAASKELVSSMWKTCYYRQIEEYRKAMKKSSAAVASKVPLSADPNEHQTIKSKAKHHLMKLVTAFQGFLAKSAGGFEELLTGLQARLTPGGADERDIYQCIFKCLLFLGDLARYRELHSEGSTKDWASVNAYYRRAFTVMPHFGNSHNQLAVVATYAESEFIAVYQYCRSVLVEHPFSVGVENLKLAYEKLLKTNPTCLQHSAISAGKQGFTKAVFTKFLFFNASLFIHSLRAVPSSSKFAGIKINDSIAVPSLDDLLSQLPNILSEFDDMWTQYKLSDNLLLKMLVVAIFSVHFGSSGQLYLDSMEYSASFRTHTESLSISLLLGIVTKLASKVFDSSREKSSHGPNKRLLPVLAVFSDWASVHSCYLENATAPQEEYGDDLGVGVSTSLLDVIRVENRYRSGLRSTMVHLKGKIEKHRSSSGTLRALILSEHVELRGFFPLKTLYESVYFHDKISMEQNFSTDENADIAERLQIIKVFIDSDLVPIAEAELAIRSGENKPSKPENSTRSVEKRSRKSISSEKKLNSKSDRNKVVQPKDSRFLASGGIRKSVSDGQLSTSSLSRKELRVESSIVQDIDISIPKQRGTLCFENEEMYTSNVTDAHVDEDSCDDNEEETRDDEVDDIIVFNPFGSSSVPMEVAINSSVTHETKELHAEEDIQITWESLDKDFMGYDNGFSFRRVSRSPFDEAVPSSLLSNATAQKAFVSAQPLLSSATLRPPPGLVLPQTNQASMFSMLESDQESEIFDIPIAPPSAARGPPAVPDRPAVVSSTFFPSTKNPFFR